MFCTWHEVASDEISLSTPPQRYNSAAQRRAVPCPAMPYRALQLSSVAHPTASSAERIAVCFAVLCRLRHAACFAVLLLVHTYMPVSFEVSFHVPVHTPGLFVHITLFGHEQCTPSSGQPGYIVSSSAAQRSAVRCLTLPFVLRCCVVRRCSLFLTCSSSSTRYDTGTRFMYALFTRLLRSSVDCPLSVPMPPPPPPPQRVYIHTAVVQNVT